MPKTPPSADQDPAVREEDAPLMPDSVLRRIDDDIQLGERRDLRHDLFGHAIDRLMTMDEAREEEARRQEAKAQGRTRPRRQVTFGSGSGGGSGGGEGETERPYLLLLLLVLAAFCGVVWLVGRGLGA